MNPSAPSSNVLYASDDEASLAAVQAAVGRRPHLQLRTASDGRAATEHAATAAPALLLMDLRLADCMGSELLPLLQRRFHWNQVPAVAVCSQPGFRCENSAFGEAWVKPLDADRVLERLDALLPAR